MLGTAGREMEEGGFSGEHMSESQRETLDEQAEEYRAKAKAAQAAGKTAEAKKWDAKELAVLGKIHGTAPVVGSEGRQI